MDRMPCQYRAALECRLKILDELIAASPHWGAALTAMDEERTGIRAALAAKEPQR